MQGQCYSFLPLTWNNVASLGGNGRVSQGFVLKSGKVCRHTDAFVHHLSVAGNDLSGLGVFPSSALDEQQHLVAADGEVFDGGGRQKAFGVERLILVCF